MIFYLAKRIILIIPTLIIIMALNFVLINIVPGGPIQQILNMMESQESFNVTTGAEFDQQIITELTKQYELDQPLLKRFLKMLKDYIRFDFGTSFFTDEKVINIILRRLPTSITLSTWSVILSYLISIPLGIKKALKNGKTFDNFTSFVIGMLHSLPNFAFAIILIILFSKAGIWQIFPFRGLTSNNWNDLSVIQKIIDYAMHICLPTLSIAINHIAFATMLVKNSFLAEINKSYVITAFSKGLKLKQVLYGHIFRNAMMVLVIAIPHDIIKTLLIYSVLIESMFSLDGIGSLIYDATIKKDYPVVLAGVYMCTIVCLIFNIISDVLCIIIDKRVTFHKNN